VPAGRSPLATRPAIWVRSCSKGGTVEAGSMLMLTW
jgi:hypothetical protein